MDENVQNDNKGRNIIIGIILGVLALAGISSYVAYQNNQDFKNAVSKLLMMEEEPAATSSIVFGPAATEGVPFVATTKTTDGDETVGGVLTSDGMGNVSYVYQAAGQNASITYTPDAYYVCNKDEECVKYATTETTGSGFNPENFQFDGSRIAELKSSANYQGQEACPAPATGTCEVWSVTNGTATSTIYVNAQTKRVARVTTASGTTSTEATYDYQNTTVTIPTNFTTAPVPSPTPTTTSTPMPTPIM